ncbi:polysaccharide biosynthesis/export family protein [Pelagibacterium lacus]|uniref:Sugar ABC transporter substrate-binding protein n=1 Tax=Pelagibacterium lacus TaxID=2282655 RepID=A0A369W1A1_9HYPH|nr:polysaccharide biosynthesis/export family protein [Pelagibacterium lacus]RDE07665.1 sugar ABC transporter substrate-binding protein [Pelagibacterium lacus]
MIRVVVTIFAALSLAGCSTLGHTEFPVTPTAQESLPDDLSIVKLDPTNISYFQAPVKGHVPTGLPPAGRWDYKIGVGDILDVIVFDHPELTLPAGPERSAVETGFRIQSDGTFFYPFVGQVYALGRAPEEIRAVLSVRLAEFIPSPQLEVRVAAFNSQRVVIAGEVHQPNRQSLTTTPLSLLEAINAAGGLTEKADARHVTVQRNGRTYRVDLQGFLAGGMVGNNPILVDGDVISVPSKTTEEAFVLGQVIAPGNVDLSGDPVSLTQALSRQGWIDELRADARGVFVFRLVAGRMVVYQLDTSTPMGLLLGTRFILEPQDVVYVTRSPLSKWNDTISALLPTVQAVRSVQVVTADL